MSHDISRECIERIRDHAIEKARKLGTVILDEMPEDWRDLHGMTQPNGTFWAGHGSYFNGTHESALVWTDWMKKLMREVDG